MKLATPLNPTSSTIDRNTRRIAANLHQGIQFLNDSYDLLWSQPDEDLVEWLNLLGPARVVEVFTAHNTQAVGLNSLLDACVTESAELQKQFPGRAIDVAGRVIDWGEGVPEGHFATLRLEAGLFVAVPLPQPPEEPPPEP